MLLGVQLSKKSMVKDILCKNVTPKCMFCVFASKRGHFIGLPRIPGYRRIHLKDGFQHFSNFTEM